MDEQYNSEKVISRIEKHLLYAKLISSSFQDILDGKLNKKRRRIQLMFAFLLLGMLMRFWISCYLYTRDHETVKDYKYWIVDYMDTLGLVGRCLNAIYGCNFITMTINRFFFRSWESSGKLEFLTEMLSLKSGQRRKNKGVDGLTDDERNKFISLTHKKLMFLNIALMSMVLPCDIFHAIGCGMFIYQISRSIFVSICSLIILGIILIVNRKVGMHIFIEPLCFHTTVDYFAIRIKSLINRFHAVSCDFTEEKLIRSLRHYDRLLFDLKKRNSSLRFLLRNMYYGYCGGMSFAMSIFAIDMDVWMRFIILTGATSFSGVILSAELYIGSLHQKIVQLYNELNFASVRFMEKPMSITTRTRLQTAIKELGSEQRDGQFVVGWTNGTGGAFRTRDAVDLTLTVCSLTLMIMKDVHYH